MFVHFFHCLHKLETTLYKRRQDWAVTRGTCSKVQASVYRLTLVFHEKPGAIHKILKQPPFSIELLSCPIFARHNWAHAQTLFSPVGRIGENNRDAPSLLGPIVFNYSNWLKIVLRQGVHFHELFRHNTETKPMQDMVKTVIR